MIHILLHEHLVDGKLERVNLPEDKDYMVPLHDKTYRILPSGRHAMTAVLNSLNLEPADEVYLTTSSGQTYISACVTCTIFNFCQPSRKLTENTHAIFIIHENGVPHPNLHQLLEEGKKRGIPVIEDCAHTYDSKVSGQRVGTIGDYGFFSLPKIFPMETGGILLGFSLPSFKLKPYEEEVVLRVEKEFHLYGPLISHFSLRRRENYQGLQTLFSAHQLLFELNENITPIFFGVYLQEAWRIRKTCRAVQWGSTLLDNLLLIPTNPMIETENLVATVADAVQKYL